MRLLHHLADSVSVWPFDPLRPGGSAVVEIYCRAFIRMGGARGLKLRTCADLNRALAGLGSASAEDQCYSDHQRSEEHTSELQSLMRISYAVFCLKKKNDTHNIHKNNNT